MVKSGEIKFPMVCDNFNSIRVDQGSGICLLDVESNSCCSTVRYSICSTVTIPVLFLYSLATTRRIKPRRNKAGPANPLKHLSQRTDIATEYVEDVSSLQNMQNLPKTKITDSSSKCTVISN